MIGQLNKKPAILREIPAFIPYRTTQRLSQAFSTRKQTEPQTTNYNGGIVIVH